ncbi:hypothetical protein A2715_05640 [Candidatus Woesebacteria bacterium RIFCSPHIGHO2_01_FULL_39_32]|uniref:Uncharacterized protein n=1 Tax=Candidatus Woesebacteria bacterium RIFCSPLOWO2_01_FULL_39_25 TaxID=1802521 RepID=A0A1F8BLW6_9BACT|nr:MAG: hypothetical protein A2124_04085 [Candidatus Woesebacteria bacterium GWB1_37_5]OGM25502.1 MAG: hypothetical protein A2715_05640 [Candidatus Woesebacteria bacterium RIFCSPHIGHO2_01_FULL_39_32]OGM36782.1 MAG: hypothetical protein A3F01_00110 [Candidatus Woesebacteria bacterium RIFCSPHIGHO2_12_FULL_38_11]OGM65033.1 MAG: hypothetical protein A2893_05250 [Candidatus Woesebacteria bacterium RIFCSPLOWO2_01_FULL_39_25]
MGYFKDTIKGISWMGALRGTTRAIAFIKIGFLARILSPFEFGLFGIASLVLAFLEILTETGINAFLVQEESDIKEYINSAWIVSLVRGFLIAFLILILAIPVSTFFNSPESIRLLFLISTVPFLRGFINPAVVNFQKKLQFNKEFNFRLTIFTFDAIVTIFLAILLKSAESLVWGMIAGSLLEIILSWLLVRPLPRFNIESVKVKKVFQRGKWITLAGIFDYLFHNIDDALVGRLINTTSLGLYQIAYKISTLPITEGGEVVSKVVFPVYTRIYGDRERLRTAYFKVLGSITLVTIPFGLFLIIFAEPFVLLFLGSKWLEIIPALKVLSVFGVVRAISGSTSALFLAIKKQEYITLVTFVSIAGLSMTALPLISRFGMLGAAYASLIGAFVSIPVMFHFARKVLYEKG